MSRSTVVTLVVALMLGSGIAGYLIGNPPQSIERPATTVATAPKPAAPAATTTPASNTATADSNSSAPVALPQPPQAPSETLTYRRTSVDSSHADAEACLYFNMPLATADSVKYGDFVRIAPDVKPSMHVVDDRLCIGGLAYGTDYAVTLLKGFPSKSGATLASDRKVDVALGARPAVVSLPGKGFILPRGEAVGLPITTVNVSKVGVAVYRVNERGLNAWNRYGNSFPSAEPVTESWSLRSWLNGTNGVQLWRGNMKVRNVLNQSVTTAFPIRETIKDWKPGVYFVVAWNAAKPPAKDDDDSDDDSDDTSSADAMVGTWVIDTDIALTSFTGRDGLSVFARSLHSAQPVAGLDVTLLSRGNEPIGKVTTTADGRAFFAAGLLKGKGAAEPSAVMAMDGGKQDFSRLELTKSAFDLSDRGIEGRDQPGPVDAYLYTERGIYRPGETVHLMAMLRDDSANALANVPVTLIVHRPDGSEFTRYAMALPASGSLYQAIAIPKGARRGQWSVTAHIDPKAPAVGTIDFSVQDFVPEKLKVEMTSDAELLRNGKKNGFNVSADFLYGAPASGLTVEGDMRITLDDTPFPAFAAYSFGLEGRRDKFEAPLITLNGDDTDDKGKSRLEWPGTDVKDTSLPLKAQVEVRVFEPGNGRATKTSKSFPFRTRDAYIGIASTFSGRYAAEGTETAFDLVAVDASGKQIAMEDVEYTIKRTTYNYQWYQTNGRWYWQSTEGEHVVDANTVSLKADGPVRISKKLEWGPHVLTVTDRKTGAASSSKFYVGWYGGDDKTESPDTLKVATDKKGYAPGDTAKIHIDPPFAGEALVTIASDKILATYTTKVEKAGTTIDVPVKGEWGPGAYALVTAWRPLASPAERTPVRAVGAAWIALDPKLRTLTVQMAPPEKIVPRQHIEVPVHVGNASGGEAYVTLAAVDEGILQLTRFQTPKPADYYFGKRALGLSMRDDYGHLLDARADDLGRLRSGGDTGGAGLDVVPIHVVSLFSGPVKLDDKGDAKVGLDVPDFAGQLRLMAVAYDKTRVGSADARLFVRDAVTADVVLPRFLAPNDQSRVALSLHNVDGAPGDYKVTLQASGAVQLDKPVDETRKLASGQRELLTWPLKAGDAGFGKVVVSVSGPNNFSVTHDWDIQVRSAQTPSANDTVSKLDAGRELTVSSDVTAGFERDTTQVSVALSRVPGIDVAALLRALDKYPYGCIEQTTSRAMPLLYYNDVAMLGYGPADPKITDRVQEAIYRITDMQTSDGSFGMWGPTSYPAAEWLQSYALDFLLRARDQQMAVPTASLQRGLTWLNRTAERLSPNAQAYAWYVLAKAGLADPGRVRYFQDAHANDIVGGLAWAQLAAALNQVGEGGRARLAFATARKQIDQRDRSDYYGTPLRDRAAILTLASEAGGSDGVTAVLGSVQDRLVAHVNETTTQEQAWLILAAHAMGGGGELAYSVDGAKNRTTKDPVVLNPDAATLQRGLKVRNDGDKQVWLQVTARGVPKDPQPAATQGLTLERSYYTLTGEAADLAHLRQNDRLVVTLSGYNAVGGYHQTAVLDLLPAGFEIESVINDETAKSFPFLPKLSETRMIEARDDRFFAAIDLGDRPFRAWWDNEGKNPMHFEVAYIVRAVTPGTFALPAANVSDMYAPRFFGRTAMGKVVIAPR